jgi:hypothetical protein
MNWLSKPDTVYANCLMEAWLIVNLLEGKWQNVIIGSWGAGLLGFVPATAGAFTGLLSWWGQQWRQTILLSQ